MQLDGMGGGISSTSKVAIVGPSSRSDCDVEYTFGQVSLHERRIEWDQNCGNLAAAVGLFAIRDGFVSRATDLDGYEINVWQTNVCTKMVLHVPSPDTPKRVVNPGIPGVGIPIHVQWKDPVRHPTYITCCVLFQ